MYLSSSVLLPALAFTVQRAPSYRERRNILKNMTIVSWTFAIAKALNSTSACLWTSMEQKVNVILCVDSSNRHWRHFSHWWQISKKSHYIFGTVKTHSLVSWHESSTCNKHSYSNTIKHPSQQVITEHAAEYMLFSVHYH